MNPVQSSARRTVGRLESKDRARVTSRSKGDCIMTKLHSFGASTQLPPSGQTAGRTPPTELSVSAYSLIDSIGQMGAAMSFPRDAKIYSENSSADYLYKVISGTVRTYKNLSNGRRQIRAFYMPGDIFGVRDWRGARVLCRGDHRCRASGGEAECRVCTRRAGPWLCTSALEPYEPRARARAGPCPAADSERTRTRGRLSARNGR